MVVVDMVTTTYYIDNDHHEDKCIYLVFLGLDLVALGQICVQVTQLMIGRGNDFEKIESMTMAGAASFVVEAPLGCLDDRCGHFDHNTITEDISLS